MKKQGFTLLELLVVCLCLGLVAAIALPSLFNKRISANEGAAIGSLRTISTSQEQFKN